MWKDRVRRAGSAISGLGCHLWREAVDRDDPHWPPAWLRMTGIAIVFLVLVSVGFSTLAVVVHSLGASAKSSSLGLVVETPLRAYIEQHSAGLPVSATILYKTWGLTGGILFVTALLFGGLGARIGWVVFGLVSCAAVYAGTHPPAQWTATGVAACAWSLAAIFVFGSMRREQSNRRTRRGKGSTESEGERRHEDTKRRAHQFAKRQGYKDLDEYFAERGNQRIDVIARELKIPKTRVGPLREDHVEAGLSVRSTVTLRRQREIKADLRSGKYSSSEICDKYGCSPAVVKRIRAALDTSPTDKTVEGAASSPTLADSERVGSDSGSQFTERDT